MDSLVQVGSKVHPQSRVQVLRDPGTNCRHCAGHMASAANGWHQASCCTHWRDRHIQDSNHCCIFANSGSGVSCECTWEFPFYLASANIIRLMPSHLNKLPCKTSFQHTSFILFICLYPNKLFPDKFYHLISYFFRISKVMAIELFVTWIIVVGDWNQGDYNQVILHHTNLLLCFTSQLLLNMNFSSRTTSLDVQRNLEANVEKRTKDTYGPPPGKRLLIFVDDMNMPQVGSSFFFVNASDTDRFSRHFIYIFQVLF